MAAGVSGEAVHHADPLAYLADRRGVCLGGRVTVNMSEEFGVMQDGVPGLSPRTRLCASRGGRQAWPKEDRGRGGTGDHGGHLAYARGGTAAPSLREGAERAALQLGNGDPASTSPAADGACLGGGTRVGGETGESGSTVDARDGADDIGKGGSFP